jgi:hypothetical protein
MWPFKRKTHPGGKAQAETLEVIFEKCNFPLARDEIADFFKITNAEAAREGQQVTYKTEFVEGWQAFSKHPDAETARAWLHAAPEYRDMIISYFVECCPGGKFAFYHSMKRQPKQGI